MNHIFSAVVFSAAILTTTFDAKAADPENCGMGATRDMTGQFMARSLIAGEGAQSIVTLAVKHTGCTLVISPKALFTSHWYNEQKQKIDTYTSTTSGGAWKLDLSGKTPAVLPKDYYVANSHDTQSARMSKSLKVYSRVIDDPATNPYHSTIELTAYFDVEYDGSIVKLKATMPLYLHTGTIQVYSALAPPKSFAKSLEHGTPVFEVLTTQSSDGNQNARNLVISHGANWLLSAFKDNFANMIFPFRLSFYAK